MDNIEIECYLDFSCPWSYIGLLRLHDVALRNAAKIKIKPISLNTLLDTENPRLIHSRWAENPNKSAWEQKDLQLWAELWGIVIKFHEMWPFDAKNCAVAWLIASNETDPIKFATTLFEAHFRRGENLSDTDVLINIATKNSLDRNSFVDKLTDQALHKQIDGYTEELIRRGGFGTPSMFLDNQLYFGNDRVSLLEWRISAISDEEFAMPGQHGYMGN
ncbi:MAG: DsbA family protein [Pseudomonadota bacterium]|nr:DsbA family protein [Pseudomonadota bacterium]